jgi:phosphoglycolate phosphatase-like HAD superfamily hydrolase
MNILSEGNFDADKVVFVGDSINDYAGADQANIRFVGRVRPKHPNPFADLRVEKLIQDLAELDKWVEERR